MAGAELGVDEKMPILKRSRLSTGIPDLDLILEGGYQNPGNIVMVGPSSMEKAAFAYHFAGSAASNEVSFIICGNSSPADIISKASNVGISLEAENIFFIDCYSTTLGTQEGEGKAGSRIKIVPGPSALNDLSLAINEAIKANPGKRMRVVFDTLSTFVLYNPKDSIRKFMSVIEGRLRSAGVTTLYLIDEGVHDKQLLSILEQGMDAIYVITDTGGKVSLKIPDVEIAIPIRVAPTGLTII